MQNNTIVNDRTGFEVYLEGIQTDFASIMLREAEGDFPSATISLPATSAAMRILGGTVVQVFGPDPLTRDKILLFEGEVSALGYQKSGSSRAISLQCTSFLRQWQTVTARPMDAMVTPKWREAQGEYPYDYINLTDPGKGQYTQQVGEAFALMAQTLEDKFAQELEGPLKDALSNIKLSSGADFADEFSRLLKDEKIANGDIHLFMQFLLRKFEIYDPFYGIRSNSYGIADSVASWPNTGKMAPFKLQAILNNTFKIASAMKDPFQGGALQLFAGIRELLTTVHYNLVAPAAYTASYKFWSKQALRMKMPVRAYMMPNLENSPPAKFNLFFPHQVTNASFSRNLLSEPTRTIGQIDNQYVSPHIDIVGALAFVTEPQLNLTQEGVETNVIGFTPEETYRGITPNVASFSNFFAEVAEDELGEKPSYSRDNIAEYHEKIRGPLNEMTLNEHLRTKMQHREFNMHTTWSPYRMIGFPAAFIEDGDGPSVTGVISAISTSITANGSASSTVTFRSPRAILDIRDLDMSDPEEMISEFTTDPYVDTNSYLFDPQIYDFNNIGSSLYTYVKNGAMDRNNEALKEYSSSGVVFEEHASTIERLYSPEYSTSEDASIIDFLRDRDFNIVNSLAEDLISEDMSKEIRKSSAYTRNIYEAIYKARDQYRTLYEEGRNIDQWANTITYREISRKRDYLSSLNIANPDDLMNYKDSVALLTGTALTTAATNLLKTEGLDTDEILELEDREAIEAKISTLDNRVTRLERDKVLFERVLGDLHNTELVSQVQGILIDDYPGFANYNMASVEQAIEEADKRIEATKEDIEKLRKAIADSNEAERKRRAAKIPSEFESDLFKPYNLTRRAHVLAATRRNLRRALQSESSTINVLK